MADTATQPASVAAPADLNSLEKRLRKLEAVVGTAHRLLRRACQHWQPLTAVAPSARVLALEGHTPSNDAANVQTIAERLQQVLQALAPVQQNEVARLLRQRTSAFIHVAESVFIN